MSTVVDFARFNGPVYKGRDCGASFREELCLDALDESDETVEVTIPEGTYTVTSSFFLGLFGPSVVSLGSKERFYRKYHFHIPEFLKADLDGYVARALQSRPSGGG